MSKVTIGLLLCMAGLILLNQHQPVIGFLLFAAGFLMANGKRRK